jgi:23S rRNA (uracil1939-C5)-methyltransferase
MLNLDQEIELEIRDLSSKGEGVGSFEGITIFVEGALVGEKVVASIILIKKHYAKGVLVRIVRPSKQRVNPICPIFDRCGGCQIMHLSYDEQLDIKERRVRSAFERIGGFSGVLVEKIIPSPRDLHYRNKITLPVVWQGGEKVIGLYAKGSHDVVPLSHCYIHLKEGEQIFSSLKEKLSKASGITAFDQNRRLGYLKHIAIRTAEHSGESLVIFLTTGKVSEVLIDFAKSLMESNPSIVGVLQGILPKDRNTVFADHYHTIVGRGYLEESFGGYALTIRGASFFQVNSLQAERLYSTAIEQANLNENDVVLDAYSGIGILTMMIARKARHVMGIEIAGSSIADAKKNGTVNGVFNIDWFEGLTQTLISKVPFYNKVLLNPPRGGCEPSVLEAITTSKAERIVYISCDPATLARDAAYLKTLGWALVKVLPFDMFPQTMHVESIATFLRN